MKKKIKCAIIGLGYWGPKVLKSLTKNKQLDFKYAVDKDKNRFRIAKRIKNTLKTSTEINDVFNDKDIDAVFICTPATTHFKIVEKSILFKKHTFVEKPLCTRLTEVKKLFSLAEKKKITLMSGDQYIYHDGINKIKKILSKGQLGNILFINSERLNLGRVRNDVDVKLNFSTHDLSIILNILNYKKVKKVKNYDIKILQKNISDVSFINLEFKQKIYANIYVSWLYPEKIRKLVIVGSKKMLIYDDNLPGEILIANKSILPLHKNRSICMDKEFINNFKYIKKKGKKINFKFKEPLTNEINHFYKCIINKKVKCLTGKKHNLAVLEIISKFKNY